ncbi:MAG: alpha-galactosidase [Bacteroidota bacterium]|nr:alpha-galactosidase [Bacteroidota bacterium]
MQRKRFIKISGFSAASLFFTRTNAESGASYQAMGFPSEVAILSSGQWMRLTGSGNQWTGGPVKVKLEHAGESLTVRIHAPGLELEKVRLGWSRVFPPDAKYLGDHWERSYGDLAWEHVSARRKAPWYLLVHDGRKTYGFAVKTGAASVAYWQASGQQLELFLDTHSGGSGVVLGDRTLLAATIVAIESRAGESAFQTDIRFCKMLCDHPVLPEKPVYGINDWYFAYGNNSRDLILKTTSSMADLAQDVSNRPFSVIDDGWSLPSVRGNDEYCWGDDYSKSNAKFGDMSSVAAEIKKLGMRPGLWTRPLLANKNDSPTALIPLRSDQKNLKERSLDPTLPENLQRIGDIIRLYKEWGFELIKHDYSTYDLFGRWGFQMAEEMTAPGWHFNDRSKTNAEIILQLYRTIRKAAGKMYLIGCNTVSHLSAGIFELNRIGDDTSGKEWARTVKMGVNTLGFRLPQHNAFYAADGDCVGITTAVPWKENRQWLQLLAESSAPLFISAQPEAMGAEQNAAVKKSFDLAARAQPLGIPLDWLTNPRPAKWELNGRTVDFDWAYTGQ